MGVRIRATDLFFESGQSVTLSPTQGRVGLMGVARSGCSQGITSPVCVFSQPALLYLVPACIGFPVLVALAKGEVTEMFR